MINYSGTICYIWEIYELSKLKYDKKKLWKLLITKIDIGQTKDKAATRKKKVTATKWTTITSKLKFIT
jgi:hypothetical protein